MSAADWPCSLLPYQRPPLTVEEQLRVVCDTWLNADDRNRCEWMQTGSRLVLIFGCGAPDSRRVAQRAMTLLLRLDRRGWVDLAAGRVADHRAQTIKTMGTATTEDIAAWLQLEIDWANFEPF